MGIMGAMTRRDLLRGMTGTLAAVAGLGGRRVNAKEDSMVTVRRADARGTTRIDWLDSRHSFSFGEYYDPAHMGFQTLRVINDDRIAPGAGFGTHPHRDMEIVTYVLDGALQHRDSLGNGSLIRPGEVQRMSAGTGIRHSEVNASQAEPVHLLQVWILPEREGLAPGDEQKPIPAGPAGALRLIGSRDGRAGSVTIHQDVDRSCGLMTPGEHAAHTLAPGRHAWLQVALGRVTLNGQTLAAGDGAAVSGETALDLRADEASELLLFDLA
jgi:redox-sensitive bicupin YhaK (pirin superfamily)